MVGICVEVDTVRIDHQHVVLVALGTFDNPVKRHGVKVTVLAALAGQVIVLNEGTLLMDGTPAEVFSPDTRETLAQSGLGLPDAMSWAIRLNEAGIDVGEPLTLDALAASITQLAATEEATHGL